MKIEKIEVEGGNHAAWKARHILSCEWNRDYRGLRDNYGCPTVKLGGDTERKYLTLYFAGVGIAIFIYK